MTVRIATRGSALALWQAEHVAAEIGRVPAAPAVELMQITTQGDRDRTAALSQMGGQGVFTREVQQAVLESRADLAVHSLKDLPTDPVEGLTLAAVLPRAPRCDALLLPNGNACESLDVLPKGARVGTGSLRRQSQLLSRRPDLVLGEIRGNLDTRLKKLDAGDFDAIILAEAGLRRLGWADRISLLLAPPLMYPAVGQGAIGVECRSDDAPTIELLKALDDPNTRCEVTAERALLAALHAGCHAPVGVWTQIENPENSNDTAILNFEGAVWSPNGRERMGVTLSGPADDPKSIGMEAAEWLQHAGASRFVVGTSAP
jgi:hydroxymethylbilane synthase